MQANSQNGNQKGKAAVILALFCIVTAAVSFYVSAFHTDRAFKRGDDRLMQLFDSGVYLNSARAIIKAVSSDPRASEKARLKELADMLILDGPVLPSLAAKAILIGQSLHVPELLSLALFQSSIQASISVLIFILTLRLTRKKRMALAAGLLWAIYPPAIIATQKLVTETICAALLLAVLLCFDVAIAAGPKKNLHLISLAIAGISFALLLLTKPVLMFAVLLPFLFLAVSIRGRKAFSGIIVFFVAAALSMMPFWIFTEQATGKICYLPQRIPCFNALVANNLITDGLQGLPQAPVSAEIARSKSVAAVELSLFRQDPIAHIDLNIRKLPRLFAEPWNDFRRAAILPNASKIRLAHQMLGACQWLAVVLALAATLKTLKTTIAGGASIGTDSYTAALLFLSLLGHLIYTAFEGIPRYGFTAAPLLLILLSWLGAAIIQSGTKKLTAINLFAPALLMALLSNFARVQGDLRWLGSPVLAGLLLEVGYIGLAAWSMLALVRLGSNCFQPIGTKSIKTAAAVSFSAFTLTITLAVIQEVKSADLVSELSGPVLAKRELHLSALREGRQPDWALLLIDSSKEITQSHIAVNGHKIHETPKSVYNYYQKKFDLLAFLEELSSDLKINAEDVRQWRAVPLPVEYLNLTGKNDISVSAPAGKPVTIYGDYAGDAIAALPSYEYISHSRIFVDSDCVDWRPRIQFQSACPSKSSIESNEPKFPVPANPDLSAAPGVQEGQWRLLVAVGYIDGSTARSSSPESRSIPLSALKFRDSSNQEVSAEGGSPAFERPARADYRLNADKQATHVIVEWRGKAKAATASRQQAVVSVALQGNDTIAGADQSYFDCKGQPKPESIRFPDAMQMLVLDRGRAEDINIKAIYPLDAVRGRGDRLTIEVLPVTAGTIIKLAESEISVRTIAWPDLGRGTVMVY